MKYHMPSSTKFLALLGALKINSETVYHHVCCCRLMPGVSVLPLLERNPSLIFSVQRGSAALGPGAEFMGQG
jgi:hypothetical protein